MECDLEGSRLYGSLDFANSISSVSLVFGQRQTWPIYWNMDSWWHFCDCCFLLCVECLFWCIGVWILAQKDSCQLARGSPISFSGSSGICLIWSPGYGIESIDYGAERKLGSGWWRTLIDHYRKYHNIPQCSLKPAIQHSERQISKSHASLNELG